MESTNSVLPSLMSATKHFLHALNTARAGFAAQAGKTQRAVSGDLHSARDDLEAATAGIADSLDRTRHAIASGSEPYRAELLRAYDRSSDYIKSALESASQQSQTLANSLRKSQPRTKSPMTSLVIGGLVAGAGYLAVRAFRGQRKLSVAKKPANARAGKVAKAAARKPARAPRRKPVNGSVGSIATH